MAERVERIQGNITGRSDALRMNFVMKGRDVLMWRDEKEERLQEIKEELAGLAMYTVVWAALFAVVWSVMF